MSAAGIAPTGAATGAAMAPTPAAPVIRVDGVSRWFGSVVAVSDVTFDVAPGITGLLGPNGAGKTTLLRMMTGLAATSSGTVTVFGQPVRDNPPLYKRLGVMSEHETVYGFMKGREFVRMMGRLRGVDSEDAVDRAIDLVDLADAQHRTMDTYSRGMRQRMRLAATLVHDPEILILDEPLNGADPRQRVHFKRLLQQLATEGRTIVLSSHILEEVERLSDGVLVIVAGRLAAAGNYREIRRLMTDRPHTFLVRSSDDRRLAAAFMAEPAVFGTELRENRLTVRVAEFAGFTRAVARVARDASVTLYEVAPTDDSLESVFAYLVSRR